jgi:hypothetical protein
VGFHGFDEFHGFRGTGRELRAHGDPGDVTVHDVVGEHGKVAPYGVYDLHKNEAWVSLGIIRR